MRQVDKEGSVFVLLDKLNRFVRVELGQFSGIGRTLDDVAISQQRHASFVVEIDDLHRVKIVQQPEIVIKSLIVRKKRLLKPKMPLADTRGGIAVGLQQFGKRQFVWMNSRLRVCAMHPNLVANPARITSG